MLPAKLDRSVNRYEITLSQSLKTDIEGLDRRRPHNRTDDVRTHIYIYIHVYIQRETIRLSIKQHHNMRLVCSGLLLVLICGNCICARPKMSLCQCECCPGEGCHAEILVSLVDTCDQVICSFEQCYQLYPKQCGLRPGVTNAFCYTARDSSTTTTATTTTTTERMIATMKRTTPSNRAPSMMIATSLLFGAFFFLCSGNALYQ